MYDSGRGHGMIATGGEPCTFLAIVMKPPGTRLSRRRHLSSGSSPLMGRGGLIRSGADASMIGVSASRRAARRIASKEENTPRNINLRFVEEAYDEEGL